MESTTNARGITRKNTYSGNQKLLSSTFPFPGGATISSHYDDRDWLDEVTDPLGNKVKTTYRADGKPVFVDDPLLRRSSLAYDIDGQTAVTLNPLNEGVWNESISKRGELLKVTDVTGSIDPNGYPTVAADGFSKSTSFNYLNSGDLWYRTNRRGLQTQPTSYDGLGRVTGTRTPLSKTTSTSYNNRNLVSSVQEPSFQSIDLTYDGRGRVQTRTGKLWPTGTEYTQSLGYDNNSNLLTLAEGTATLTRTYDDLNRISTYTSSVSSEQIGYLYDENSNLIKLTYPDGKEVNYTYDSRDRLETVTDWAARVTTYSWDDNNRLTQFVRPNGTKRVVSYDAAGQVKQIDERAAGAFGIIHRQTMGYDDAGRVTSTFTAPLTTPYNEAAMTAGYDLDDRMTTLNGASLLYDDDGNLLGGPLPNGAWGNTGTSTGATGAFTWDVRNRLKTVTRSGSGQVVSYAYDAEGFMVGITTGGQTERLTVDPHGGKRSQVLVRNFADGTKTRQVYGLGLLYEVRDDGSVRYYHYDSLGSTVALTDAAGTVTGRVQYGTFGAVATSSGDGLNTPWLWHGRHGVWTDKHTGMHQMRARWYSSALRRFLNPDPAGFAGGSNFYLYANGDPVSMIDPFGLGAQYRSEGYDMINLRQTTCMDCHGLPWRERAQMGLAAQQPYTTQTYKNISQAVGMTGIALAAAPVAAEAYGAASMWAMANPTTIATGTAIVAAAGGVDQGPTPNIALGLRNGLRQFSQNIGSNHLLDNPAWKAELQTIVKNPNAVINFNLDGLSGGSGVANKVAASLKAVDEGWSSHTDWEISLLKTAEMLKKVIFYENGKIVPNPF